MTAFRPAAFANPGRFWRGNTHTHSDLSDGSLPLGEVCARYRAEGYDFLSMTEHCVGLYDYPIADTTPFRSEDFTTILGAEMHTGQLGNGEIWHLVAVGLPQDFKRPVAPHFGGQDAPETGGEIAQRCRDAGAFVSIAHPQWYNLTLEDARTIEAAHAVEIYNHGCEVECDRADGTAIWDLLLSEGRRLSGCATDDAHFNGNDAFGGWVMVKAEANDPDQLLQALKDGAYYSSQGPRLHDVWVEDKQIHVKCSPCDRIMVLGAGAASKVEYGMGLTDAAFGLAKFKPGGWCRVVVGDAHGLKAWSNPIWFEDF